MKHVMRHAFNLIICLVGFQLMTTSGPLQAENEPRSKEEKKGREYPLNEMTMGDPDAPLTIVEFSSLTCSHCAAFHQETIPQFIKEYVQSGKVCYKYVHFPLDGYALKAATAVTMAGAGRRFSALNKVFENQNSWFNDNHEKKLAEFAGVPLETFQAALKDEKIPDAILAKRIQIQKEHKIDATPALLINGKIHTGAIDFSELKPLLDGAIADTAAENIAAKR